MTVTRLRARHGLQRRPAVLLGVEHLHRANSLDSPAGGQTVRKLHADGNLRPQRRARPAASASAAAPTNFVSRCRKPKPCFRDTSRSFLYRGGGNRRAHRISCRSRPQPRGGGDRIGLQLVPSVGFGIIGPKYAERLGLEIHACHYRRRKGVAGHRSGRAWPCVRLATHSQHSIAGHFRFAVILFILHRRMGRRVRGLGSESRLAVGGNGRIRLQGNPQS